MVEVLASEKQRSKRGRVEDPVVPDGDHGSFPVQLEKDRRIIRMRYRDIENRISGPYCVSCLSSLSLSL